MNRWPRPVQLWLLTMWGTSIDRLLPRFETKIINNAYWIRLPLYKLDSTWKVHKLSNQIQKGTGGDMHYVKKSDSKWISIQYDSICVSNLWDIHTRFFKKIYMLGPIDSSVGRAVDCRNASETIAGLTPTRRRIILLLIRK